MNYYKITNKEESHRGMQYQDGLNTDIWPFNPAGSCESGGIYFSREDILAFLDYGPWIRKVELPEGEQIYEDPSSSPKKFKAHSVILGPRREINLDIIKELVEEGANIHVCDDYTLRWAAKNGHLEVVKYLIEKGADIDDAFQLAAKSGYLEVVKYLAEKGADIHAGNNYALRWSEGEVAEYLKSKMN